MRVHIYYGGRGLIDDPTIYVMNKIQEVLEELHVHVERFNLFEQKNQITTLPQTLKEADAIVLATTIEWFGIGGYMQQFLDACWLYGNKEKISTTYMMPVVMSTTYGEREGQLTLINAWEMLGGIPCSGICGYVDDLLNFEMNQDYKLLLEKKAEDLYRTISQKIKTLPTSNKAVQQTVLRSTGIELTPQESELISKYVSDDSYVKKQKEDIEELTSLFKGKLDKQETDAGMEFIEELQKSYVPQQDFSASYQFSLDGKPKPLVIVVKNEECSCYYGNKEDADVKAKLRREVLESIVQGRMTFQRAFMAGDMTAKGDFKTLRMLDQIFKLMHTV